jgi:hypothetical protein
MKNARGGVKKEEIRLFPARKKKQTPPRASTISTVCCETKEFSASQAQKIGGAEHSLSLAWRNFSFSPCELYVFTNRHQEKHKNYIPASIAAVRRLSCVIATAEKTEQSRCQQRMRYVDSKC